MKKKLITILPFILAILMFSCKTAQTFNYRMTFDPSMDDLYIQVVWMSYSSYIASDLVKFYSKKPNGNYVVPYKIELRARNILVDSYLQIRKEIYIYDQYIEDLIKIRASKMFDEYIFYTYNPGNWKKKKKFNEGTYREWMRNNLPAHTPLTLVHVTKID